MKGAEQLEAIVYTDNSTLLNAFRAELRESHFSEIICPVNAEECVAAMIRFPHAILMLDWGVGGALTQQVLEASKSDSAVEIRPIFLYSRTAIQGIEGVAAEYRVLHVHVGEMTRDMVRLSLRQLLQAEGLTKPIREVMSVVSDARKRDDWATAEQLLMHALSEHPGQERLVVEAAETFVHNKKFREAAALLKPIVGDQENRDPRILNIYGRCLMAQGDYDSATIYLQQAKLINPFNIDRLIELGESYLLADNPKRAADNFQEALNLDPHHREAKRGFSKSLLVGGQINDALAFMKSLSSTSEMASVFNASAVLCMRRGRFPDGFELYSVAIRTIGSDEKILARLAFNLGIGFYRQKDLRKAHISFTIANKLDSTYEKAKQNLEALDKRFGKLKSVDLGSDPAVSLLKTVELYPSGNSSGHSKQGAKIDDEVDELDEMLD